MKKIYLCIGLIFGSILTADSLQQLADIQLEISFLERKKSALIDKISCAHHSEVNNEVKSVQKMFDYRWGEFVSDIKNAENYENIALHDQRELDSLNNKISQLMIEANSL